MRPGTRHFVLTLKNTLAYGEHFYSTATLPESLCSYVVTFFANYAVTNAEDDSLISVIQSFAYWWADALDRAATNRAGGLGGFPYLNVRHHL